jgi:hypothetical protein
MSVTTMDEALHAAADLVLRGYEVSEQRVYPEYFGSGWIVLARDDVRLRLTNDRGQWFAEIGSSADPEEWFDARLVLTEIGKPPASPGTDLVALESLCNLLAAVAPRWEVLFLRSTFASTRRVLRAREVESARERFDI